MLGPALLSADASAATVVRTDLPRMVQASDRIVVGTVVGAESVSIERSLYTGYTVAVEETLHGDEAARVTVLVPGGVDRSRRIPIGMAVAGAPTMLANGRAVLLLARVTRPTGAADYQVVGFNQGRFTVAGGRVATAGAMASRAGATEPVAAFQARLRQLVRERAAGTLSIVRPQPRRIR